MNTNTRAMMGRVMNSSDESELFPVLLNLHVRMHEFVFSLKKLIDYD